ncbi:hypothetical protein CNR22_07915 [Sphingobacteriaceae bacterium]|nr:hypothetical protein CNR22_07915 [Sphingobacteriaceae bacterium]
MKIELDRSDKISEVISALLLFVNALLLILILPTLPDTNGHFNELSTVNGFHTKNGFWGAFAIALLFYILMTVVSFTPGLYKSRMTKNNVKEQYRLTSKMARNIKPFTLLAFIVMTIFMLQSARGKWIDEQPLLFLVFFGLLISPCLYYAVKLSKIQ